MVKAKNTGKGLMARGVAAKGLIRAFAAVTTEIVEEARSRHQTLPTATAALGRVLTGALLLGAGLKEKDIITVRILGDGPIGSVVATADAEGNVRGYIQNPEVDIIPAGPGKLNVGAAVGQGFLHITKDLGLKEPYTGSVPLQTGEIGDDLAYYFVTSEQIPSAVNLGVLINPDLSVEGAAGYLIQLMPGVTEEQAEELERVIYDMDPVSNLAAAGWEPKKILEDILGNLEFKLLEEKEIRYKCNCSRERLEGILTSLGREELESMIEQEGSAEVQCHFCREIYLFNKEELEQMVNSEQS